MTDAALTTLLAYAAIFFLAGAIKGTVGIGLPTAALGLLTLFVEPRTAIALMLLPILTSNFWQAFRSGHIIRTLKRYGVFNLSIIVFITVTTTVTATVSNSYLLTALGIVIVLVALISLFFVPPPLPTRYDRLAQFVSGSLSGILGGLTAIWAPTMVTYLLAKRLDKDEFVRASGVMISVGSVPLISGYVAAGLFSGPVATQSALMILPTIAGFAVGELARHRIGAERFRTAVLTVFLIMGLNILRRVFFA